MGNLRALVWGVVAFLGAGSASSLPASPPPSTLSNAAREADFPLLTLDNTWVTKTRTQGDADPRRRSQGHRQSHPPTWARPIPLRAPGGGEHDESGDGDLVPSPQAYSPARPDGGRDA
jgi:hypothetical protein